MKWSLHLGAATLAPWNRRKSGRRPRAMDSCLVRDKHPLPEFAPDGTGSSVSIARIGNRERHETHERNGRNEVACLTSQLLPPGTGAIQGTASRDGFLSRTGQESIARVRAGAWPIPRCHHAEARGSGGFARLPAADPLPCLSALFHCGCELAPAPRNLSAPFFQEPMECVPPAVSADDRLPPNLSALRPASALRRAVGGPYGALSAPSAGDPACAQATAGRRRENRASRPRHDKV